MMESHPALIGSCEEHTAFMVERYSAQLVGLCFRLLRDRYLAQDAVQEPLLKAYLKRGSFRGENEKSEKARLMQIAVNVCRDQMRTSWFRLSDSESALDALNQAAVEAPEEALHLDRFSAEEVQRGDLDVLLSGHGGMRNRHCARKIDSCCVPKAEGGRANAQSIRVAGVDRP